MHRAPARRAPASGTSVFCSTAFVGALIASALLSMNSNARAQAPQASGDKTESRLDLNAALQHGTAPLSADQAASLAVVSAPAVARAKAESLSAREAANQVQIALYPRLDLEARYSRLEGVDDVRFMGGTIEVQHDRYALEARATVPLSDIVLQVVPRYHAAQHAAEAQTLKAEATVQDVALQAREAFYDYARARASAWVASASVDQTQAQQRDVASLVQAGSMARVELMRARRRWRPPKAFWRAASGPSPSREPRCTRFCTVIARRTPRSWIGSISHCRP